MFGAATGGDPPDVPMSPRVTPHDPRHDWPLGNALALWITGLTALKHITKRDVGLR